MTIRVKLSLASCGSKAAISTWIGRALRVRSHDRHELQARYCRQSSRSAHARDHRVRGECRRLHCRRTDRLISPAIPGGDLSQAGPARHHWGLDQICPSPKGVELRLAFLACGVRVRQIRGRRQHDRRHSDRAFWPVLRHIHRPILGPKASVSSGAARRSAYGSLAAHNCGRRVVRRSWAIEVGKSAALKATYFVLQRKSHWLVWFEYP